jgi:hypothetical protein
VTTPGLNRTKACLARIGRTRARPSWTLVLIVLVLGFCFGLVAHPQNQDRTLVIAGYPGELSLVEMGGRLYVALGAFARIVNASLSYKGNQVALALDSGGTKPDTTLSARSPVNRSEFSRGFLTAGIEQMSVIREWRSTLINAVQREYPVTEDWMASFRDRAQKSLALVSVAVSTESDQNAFGLLTGEYRNMQTLSDRFVDANKSRQYMPATSLDNDPLDRQILACEHALAAMAASGTFVDEGSCH